MLTEEKENYYQGRSFPGRDDLWVGFFFLFFFLAFRVGVVSADGINGFADFTISSFDSKTKGLSENTTQTTNSFSQTYNLWLEKRIFQNLRLDAGGLFEKTGSSTDINGEETDTTLTRLSPFIDLRLDNPLYTAGVGYRRRDDTLESTDSPGVTRINENYTAILGWRPEGFPSINARFERIQNYDKERSIQDTIDDNLSLNMVYDSIDGLELRYNPRYTNINNRLNDLEVQEFTHNGRAGYSRQFFNRRLSFFTSYRISHTETESVSAGAGEVSLQLFPLSGLSAIDATPADGALNTNDALINGNLVVSAGINIGLPPLGGNTDPRNMGLEFSSATEVDTLYVWVDRELPGGIADSFSWEIYVSSDNDNWSLLQTVFPAPFGTFQNRFEISIANVTARFIKVVTRPLQPTVPNASDFPNILVTEMQAFIRRPVDEARQNFTRTTHFYELDTKMKILDNPSLYYDLSFFTTRNDPFGLTRSFLSNGLSLSHRFSRIFSGRARVAREDTQETEDAVSYRYDASLTATPVERLSHIINYSGRLDEFEGEKTSRHSIYLGNSAELYKGVNMNLNAGFSLDKRATGEKSESTTIDWRTVIVPNPKLTMNVNYSITRSQRSGGVAPSSATSSNRGDLSLSYTPFKTMFFFLSFEIIQNETRQDTIQHYGFNWSPFPNGTLHFNFAYDENVREENDEIDRTIRPSLRWYLYKNTYLDLSYQNVMNSSDFQTSDANVLTARLRFNF